MRLMNRKQRHRQAMRMWIGPKSPFLRQMRRAFRRKPLVMKVRLLREWKNYERVYLNQSPLPSQS